MNMWQKHLAAQERSGKSVPEYCRQHGINPKRLYYWQRKRRTSGEAEFVEIGKRQPGGFELRVRDGVVIVVPERFDPEQLRQLLEVLGC